MFGLKFQSLGSVFLEPVMRKRVMVGTCGGDKLLDLWMMERREREERDRENRERERQRKEETEKG